MPRSMRAILGAARHAVGGVRIMTQGPQLSPSRKGVAEVGATNAPGSKGLEPCAAAVRCTSLKRDAHLTASLRELQRGCHDCRSDRMETDVTVVCVWKALVQRFSGTTI